MMQEFETLTDFRKTLSLEGLRSFIAICETGSFRRAAARVCRSPSAVSLQIARLEEALGVRLFHRDARRVLLTEDGEALRGHARRILSLNDETFALFRKPELSGRLTLAAPHDLGVSLVPDFLRRLSHVYPEICVDVRLATSVEVRRSIETGSAQLALFNDIGPCRTVERDVHSEPLAWLMLDGGRAMRRSPLPLAIAELGCAWRDAALDALHGAGIEYRLAYASDTSMGQVAALRADLAIAALPLSLAGHDLVEVPGEFGLPPLPRTHIRVAEDGSDLAVAIAALLRDGPKAAAGKIMHPPGNGLCADPSSSLPPQAEDL
jgi:DNA-binding transcriptional LysR family regulator